MARKNEEDFPSESIPFSIVLTDEVAVIFPSSPLFLPKARNDHDDDAS